MPEPELHTVMLAPLQRAGIPHMVTGAVAAIIYGEPRLTNDIDVVLDLRADDAPRLVGAFTAAEYYVPPVEVVREELGRLVDGHFNIIHHESSLRADCYPIGRTDALARWGMERRRTVSVGGEDLTIAPAEYVILNKLKYYAISGSDRHLVDIRAMLRLSGSGLDVAAIEDWVERLGLEEEWRLAGTPSAGG